MHPPKISLFFFRSSILRKIIFHLSRVSQVVANCCVTREIRIKKNEKEEGKRYRVLLFLHPLTPSPISSSSFTPPLSRPTVNPTATRGVSSWKDSRVRLLFRLGNVACALPLCAFSPPFSRPHSNRLVGESLLKLMWPRTSGYTPGNEARIGLDFFLSSFFFFFFLSFPRGETVARDREKGWRSGWKAGKEREINYCHALNGCTCGLEASFFLSDAPGN